MSKPVFTKQFYASWICSTGSMFSLAYFWHGVVLNDYNLLTYPKGIFFSCMALVYLIIGFSISYFYRYLTLQKKIRDRFLKGIISGGLIGILLYSITWILGISYSKHLTFDNILLDLIWQVVEQTLGGVTVSIIHYSIWVDERFSIQRRNSTE